MFENTTDRAVHTKYYLPTIEKKGLQCYYWPKKNLFDQLVKIGMRTYDNILKIATGRGDDYTIGCLLN